MVKQLKRLLSTGVAYQSGEIVAKLLALGMLPLYTRYLSRADYGTAETLVTLIILISIVVRLGLGDAGVRFYFLRETAADRARIARLMVGATLVISTVLALAVLLCSSQIAEVLLDRSRTNDVRVAALGLWAFSNLDILQALLRAAGRVKLYVISSLTNVFLTVSMTVTFVVGYELHAVGYLLGNYLASTVIFCCLVIAAKSLFTGEGEVTEWRKTTGPMLKFGLPTVPAEAAVYALFVIDRLWLYHYKSAAVVGIYSLAVKLATGVIFAVRAFQFAWPPIAYAVADDGDASSLYARVATYYTIIAGLIVAAISLYGRWVVAVFAAPAYHAAVAVLPWVALGWATYGFFLILLAISGRVGATIRNLPASIAGLAVNIVLLVMLVGPLGAVGAGIALSAACTVMVAVMYLLVRSLLPVPFEWRRITIFALTTATIVVAADWLFPSGGIVGLGGRTIALIVIPMLLWLMRFFDSKETFYLKKAVRIGSAGLRRV